MTQRHIGNCERTAASGEENDAIRPARTSDLPGIVSLHQRAFRSSFLTQLGNRFLGCYYALVLGYPGGILIVRDGSEGLEGFACGFVEPERFYRRMSQNKWRFSLPVLAAVVRHPSLARRIAQGIQRVEKHVDKNIARSCELSSVAVSPESRGRGVGPSLVSAFLLQARFRRADQVYLDTDADNGPANLLYHNAGFHLCRRFQRYEGRWMNEYVIDLVPAREGLRVL